MMQNKKIRSTTILCVIRNNQVAVAGDGQVSAGNTIMKGNATKVRKIYNDKIITGFAGATADAFTLLEKFEEKLQTFSGNLTRASVELAKDWRTDKMLRRLEAMLIVADKERAFLLTGTGDVIEPEDGIIAIGSGGNYALSAARALVSNTDFSASEIAQKSLEIAGDICIYTNKNIILEEIK